MLVDINSWTRKSLENFLVKFLANWSENSVKSYSITMAWPRMTLACFIMFSFADSFLCFLFSFFHMSDVDEFISRCISFGLYAWAKLLILIWAYLLFCVIKIWASSVGMACFVWVLNLELFRLWHGLIYTFYLRLHTLYYSHLVIFLFGPRDLPQMFRFV